jgi:hypothetical protein
MDAFEVCLACRRHIKKVESSCPFCGANHAPRRPRAGRPTPRLSRAGWLASALASSLAVASCGGEALPGPSPEESRAQRTDAAAEGEPTGADAAEPPADAEVDVGVDATGIEDAGAPLDAGHDSGWHGCYGCPPARLERAT